MGEVETSPLMDFESKTYFLTEILNELFAGFMVEDAGQNVEFNAVLSSLKLIRHMDCPS